MRILGLQKTTLLDYPEHVAATIFLGGCNFRCPFCHNMDIVIGNDNQSTSYSEEEIINFLKKRSGVLDGVCITGGEPTLYKTLPEFIKKIKSIGNYLVKLDTNGTNPEMIKMLISEGLIDYVAMDVKSSMDKYDLVAGFESLSLNIKDIEKLKENIAESINILISSDIDYEFRTTVIADYHDIEDITKIGNMINGAKAYYLQSFTDSDWVPDHTLKAFDKQILEEYKEILSEYVDKVEIRGVD